MAKLQGTILASKIVPTDSLDTYATHEDVYGRGGHRSVDTIVERDEISPERRKEGMTVYVKSTKVKYVLEGGLTNEFWEAESTGGSTGGIVEFSSLTPEQIEIIRGPQGPMGQRGLTGFKGDTGEQGFKGDVGPVGPPGPRGDKGEKGDQGDTGLKGDKGDTGAAGTTLWAGITGKPETATRWPTFDEVTGKPATFTPTVHTHPVSQVTGLGTASAMDVGTAAGNVMAVGALGLGHSFPYEAFDANLIADQVGNKSGFYPYMSNSGTNLPYDYVYIYQVFLIDRGNLTQIAYGYNTPEIWIRYRYNNVWSPWAKNYNTFNTTKNPDGTIKASSPVINLYTDKHDLHNELEFGATPVVTRKSKGVYEITGTLGLRSEGWYVDTPNDRNGNKYFNIEWTQNITPEAVDGVVDEYRDDIVVTIETFERVWNKDTGMFDNGNPIDINDLQNRFVQLRFNELKVGEDYNL